MVRITPFLPLISSAAMFAPTVTATATASNRQESYAAVRLPHALPHVTAQSAGYRTRRQFLTCEQTYGEGWIQCGDIDSTFCYNPSEGQTCCAQDAGYCDPGMWCAPVPGFCCVDGEDIGTCAVEAGFELPTGIPSGATTFSLTATTTRSSTVTRSSSTTTSTTLSMSSTATSAASSSSLDNATTAPAMQIITTCATAGGLTWTSVYPATVTGFGNETANSTGTATPSSTYIQISVAQKGQSTLVWMATAMGAVAVFMTLC